MPHYQYQGSHDMHFLTLTVVDWVDVFTRPVYKNIIIDSLNYCIDHKGLQVHGFVLMTNHLHLIASSDQDKQPLPDIIQDFKSFTAKEILKAIDQNQQESRRDWLMWRFKHNAIIKEVKDRDYQFWLRDDHPIVLYTLPVIKQKLDYIHLNPIKQSWVDEPEHFLYSSASNYSKGHGLVKVSCIELPWSMEGYVMPLNLE